MLRVIKDELERFCDDTQFDLPKNTVSSIRELRHSIMESNQWTQKTEHLRLKAMQALWQALKAAGWVDDSPTADFLQTRWWINTADGWLEEALRVDSAERLKGIPKEASYLSSGSVDGTVKWIDTLIESDTEVTTSEELYTRYTRWMAVNAPESEILTAIALGQRLGKEGLSRTTKRIDGKAAKVWKVVPPD